MARPKADDPRVPLPVRVPTSMLVRLQEEASTQGVTLTALVHGRLDQRTGVDPRPALVPSTSAASTPGARCICSKPLLSKIAPVCTSCHLRR